MTRRDSALVLSPLIHYEFANALRFAEFRRVLKPAAARQYWALFKSAVGQGRLIVEKCNLADVVDEARRLSAIHTASGGYRAFGILHVAAALKLGATEFLTFDENQKRLAESEGLRVTLSPAKSATGLKLFALGTLESARLPINFLPPRLAGIHWS
jgi:predicted nucleic acid-binding protein